MATIAQLAVILSLDKRNFSVGLQQAQNEAEQGQRRLGDITGQTVKSLALTGLAYYDTAKQVIQVLDEIATRGLMVNDVATAFTARVGDQDIALQRLRAATNGMVSSYDLMTQANISLTLGSAKNISQFADMAEVAQKLGRALGLDAAFALNSLNIGISRQSKLILDNLGIMVDIEQANLAYALSLNKTVKELTDQEKAQAFASEAMRQARVAADAMSVSVDSSGMAFARLKTSLVDAKDELARQGDESVRLRNFFEYLEEGVSSITNLLRGNGRAAWIDLKNGILDASTAITGIETDKAAEGIAYLNSQANPIQLQGFVVTIDKATEALGRLQRASPINLLGFGLAFEEEIDILESGIRDFFEGFRQGGEEVTKLEEAINPLTGALNDYGTASAIIARAEDERRNFLPDLTSAVHGQKNAIQAYSEEVFREIAHQEMLNGALKEQISLRQQLSTFRGILGGIAGIAGMFSFLSPVTNFISGASRGLGLFDKLGLFPKAGAAPMAGFSQAAPAASPVVVNLYGPAMSQLVSDITVEQNRAVTYRRVARVA